MLTPIFQFNIEFGHIMIFEILKIYY